MGADGGGPLYRHAPDRPVGPARTELGADWRRQQRPATGPEVRPHGIDALIAPVGNSHYNAIQTRLSRRFNDGFSFNVNYTLSRAIGLRGAPNSDNQPVIRIPDMFELNRGLADFDRTHVLNVRSIAELPFGEGPPVAERDGPVVRDIRRLAAEQHRELSQRHAVHRDHVDDAAQHAKHHAEPGRPGQG